MFYIDVQFYTITHCKEVLTPKHAGNIGVFSKEFATCNMIGPNIRLPDRTPTSYQNPGLQIRIRVFLSDLDPGILVESRSCADLYPVFTKESIPVKLKHDLIPCLKPLCKCLYILHEC